jgi:hypothetical protein
MPTLVHPQHTVHTLHGTAGANRLSQDRRHPPVRFLPVRFQLPTILCLNQRGSQPTPSTRSVRGNRHRLPQQPPPPDQRFAQLRPRLRRGQLPVHPVQKRQAAPIRPRPPQLGPLCPLKVFHRRGNFPRSPRSIVQPSIWTAYHTVSHGICQPRSGQKNSSLRRSRGWNRWMGVTASRTVT